MFIGSVFLTPLLLWLFVAVVLGRDYSFPNDYLDFYRELYSLQPDMVFCWIILLLPVVFYQFALACRHYYRHPEELRSVFQFPPRNKR